MFKMLIMLKKFIQNLPAASFGTQSIGTFKAVNSVGRVSANVTIFIGFSFKHSKKSLCKDTNLGESIQVKIVSIVYENLITRFINY